MAKSDGGVVFERVTKRYGSVTAVDDVSFEVAQGELVTLLGPSGCGKTTTLRMVAGLEAVTSGRVLIGGTDVTLRAANERDVSMVFQSYALFPHMTVLENVCYGPLSMRTDKPKAREMARAKLAMLGLSDFEARLPSELSGGQQQRVAVARSLVLEPAVLLFDEPLSNLDAKLRRRVREEIRELQQSLALTVLYVTHDQEEALAVSDHIIVMNGGRIAQQGTPDDAVRNAGESLPRRLHRRCEPRRRRARSRRARRIVCRGRHYGAGTRRRHGGGPGDAGGASATAAARRGGARRASRHLQARVVSGQPHRIRRRHRVGRAAGVRRRGAHARAAATTRSALLSTTMR